MQITLTINPTQIRAIARILNAEAAGNGYDSTDAEIRTGVLKTIVGQAAICHGVLTPEIAAVTHRDFMDFQRTRRLPKSTRVATRQLR